MSDALAPTPVCALTVRVQGEDPLSAAPRLGTPSVYLECPDRGTALAGFGVARSEVAGAAAQVAGRVALEAIRAGRLEKVVVARALDVLCARPPDPVGLLTRLRARFPSCLTYLLQGADGACLVGATPERLCAVDGPRLSTEALA